MEKQEKTSKGSTGFGAVVGGVAGAAGIAGEELISGNRFKNFKSVIPHAFALIGITALVGAVVGYFNRTKPGILVKPATDIDHINEHLHKNGDQLSAINSELSGVKEQLADLVTKDAEAHEVIEWVERQKKKDEEKHAHKKGEHPEGTKEHSRDEHAAREKQFENHLAGVEENRLHSTERGVA